MPPKEGKANRGEMRRRHEAIIRSGVLRSLRSEGRMVLSMALCWADYATCQFRMSARGAAAVAGVQPTAVRRGLQQLIEAGVIEAGPAEVGKRQKYRFRPPQKGAHTPCAPLTHSVSPPRTHPVSTPDTGCARAGHTPCAGRTPPVSGARTGCVPYSSIVLKGSSRTREDTSVLAGSAGPDGPACRDEADSPLHQVRQPSQEDT
jgi:hypothetical protein